VETSDKFVALMNVAPGMVGNHLLNSESDTLKFVQILFNSLSPIYQELKLFSDTEVNERDVDKLKNELESQFDSFVSFIKTYIFGKFSSQDIKFSQEFTQLACIFVEACNEFGGEEVFSPQPDPSGMASILGIAPSPIEEKEKPKKNNNKNKKNKKKG